MKRQRTISAHVIQFCRFLRKHDFYLGPQEEMVALKALKFIPYHKARFFKTALSAALCKNKNNLDRFDELYLQYWNEVRRADNSKLKDVEEKQNTPERNPQESGVQVIRKWLNYHKEEDEIEVSSYDIGEVFRDQDFSSFKKDDLSEVLRHSEAIVKKLTNKKGRRFMTSNRQGNIDLRKVMRSNIARSDEFIQLTYRKKKIEKLSLLLICDVSRSMELYAKFLIQFMYGLSQANTRLETFVFSTSLERVTKSLRQYDFEAVLAQLKTSFDQWSGGTRIGYSLSEFMEKYATQFLDYKTKVIILSDGWDTGEAELVSVAMKELSDKCSKIIWLNPLAGNPMFKPETACLKAALPYVDVFQAANSVRDLRSLVKKLR